MPKYHSLKQQTAEIVEYEPVTGFNKCIYHSITLMREYLDTSFEELRYEYYWSNQDKRKAEPQIPPIPSIIPPTESIGNLFRQNMSSFERRSANGLRRVQKTTPVSSTPSGSVKTASNAFSFSMFQPVPAPTVPTIVRRSIGDHHNTSGETIVKGIFGDHHNTSGAFDFTLKPTSATKSIDTEPILFEHEVLRELRCDECLNYLSVGPVVIAANGRTLCGRCSSDFKDKMSLTKSLFNVVAEEALFRCINHYDGCDAVLSFDKMTKHESACTHKSNDYDCLFCSYKAPRGSQMVRHYEKYHPAKVVKNGTFKLRSDDEIKLVYFDDNDMLAFKVSMGADNVRISAYRLNGEPKKKLRRITFEKENCGLWFDVYLMEYGRYDDNSLVVSVDELRRHFVKLDDVSCKVGSSYNDELSK